MYSRSGAGRGKECCGKPCPGPPAGWSYGGRLFVTHGGPSTNMSFGGLSGIAAADAICASQAPAASGLGAAHYKALLADEGGCGGKPCRRASITPGVGDGAIDWVIAPRAAYYLLDNATLVALREESSSSHFGFRQKNGFEIAEKRRSESERGAGTLQNHSIKITRCTW